MKNRIKNQLQNTALGSRRRNRKFPGLNEHLAGAGGGGSIEPDALSHISEPAPPILSIREVEKSYKSGSATLSVLKDVNLEVQEGESIAIMGASGCGKSTLLNLIGGLDRVNTGEINFCGFPVNGLSENELTAYRARAIGFVFQFHYLLKDFTALENVMLPLLMQGKSKRLAADQAWQALEQVSIASRGNHYPSQLSGGERQRTAFARALINDPSLILADEPTGNLDEEHKKLVADLVFSLIRESGKTLLLVTHSEDLAVQADRVYLLKEGLLQPK